MKRIDFQCAIAVGLVAYFAMAFPAYLDLLKHQPDQSPLNQATGFPPSAAWIYPIPLAIICSALGMISAFLFRKFFRPVI